MPLTRLGLSEEYHVYTHVFCRLSFPFVQLTRGQSPGRRRRTRHDEAACNIEEKGGGRGGWRMWRRGKGGEEVKIPKPLEERRKEEEGGASWVEEQVGRYGKGGVL